MSTQGIMLSLVTILVWGIGSTLDKYVIGAFPSPLSLVSLRAVVIGGVFIAYGLLTGRFSEVAATPVWAVTLAILAAVIGPILGQVAYYLALAVDEASRVVPVTSAYPIVLAILSFAFLGEKLTWTKGTGIVLVVVGILLLSGMFNGPGASADA